MNQMVFKIGDIILGRIKGYPNWPGIIEKKTKKEEKEIKKDKYKVKLFGKPSSIAYLSKRKMIKYCKELINKEQLSKNLTLQQAVEQAESALKFNEEDIKLRYPVDVSINYQFDVSYKIKKTNEMMNNYILIFDIIEYLKNLSIRMYEFCYFYKYKKPNKETVKLYFPLPPEDFECLSLSLNLLKQFKYGIDFLGNTKLGILLAFLAKNLATNIKQQKELKEHINEIIKTMKEQCE